MENDHWLTLAGTLSGALAKPNNNCDPQTAAALATLLFGCYRASEANDPETFIAAAAATLARYPTEVVIAVTDPVRGLPSTNKWLPSIAEIREVCEQAMAPRYAEERRQNERAHTERVTARVGKARIGSPEHMRVLKGLKDLRAELWPADAPDARGKAAAPDARRAATPELKARAVAYHEAKLAELAKAPPPQVNTLDMANYLADMRASESADLALNTFDEAQSHRTVIATIA
jgi:hypothetical protein